MRNWTLHEGDNRDALAGMASNSVDSVVTDPPYHLQSIQKRFANSPRNENTENPETPFGRTAVGFMGKAWDGGDIAFRPEFWAEVLRVLKPGAYLCAFGATRGYHRMACAIEDAGFEIRDSLAWLYGTGFPKSHDVSKGIDRAFGAVRERGRPMQKIGTNTSRIEQGYRENEVAQGYATGPSVTPEAAEWAGWGTALKPAFEPIVLARKPLSEGTVAANVLRWRTGAINIDGCRIGLASGETPYSYPNGRGGEGWHGRDSLSGNLDVPLSGNDGGRWPANVVTDGSAEVVEAFPSQAGGGDKRVGIEPGTRPGGFGNVGHDSGDNVPNGALYNDSGSAARFFFSAKESDIQWLVRNLPNALASDVPECFSLDGNLAVTALSNAVAQSTPLWAVKCDDCPARSMNVTASELRQISALLIGTILSFDERCSQESLPEKRIHSTSLVNVAATRERTDTIAIIISPSKSSGSVAPVTFKCTLRNEEVGARDYAKRFHYSAKASKQDRAGSKHPTVKPINLKRWLCRLVTPPGGVVLDPFAGSGTTGAAALAEGFRVVLCEREAEYVRDIKRRLGGSEKPLAALLARYRRAKIIAETVQNRVDSHHIGE